MGIAMDQIVNQAAKNRYMFGGKATLPIVYRASTGAGVGNAAQHTQSLEAWFAHVPGLKVVCPSNPSDAQRPYSNRQFATITWCASLSTKPSTQCAVRSLPVNTWSRWAKPKSSAGAMRPRSLPIPRQVNFALQAAEQLSDDGIEVEVIDLRTLYPFDAETIIESVQKTNRAMVLHEAVRFGGFGGEITSQIQEKAFDWLDAPIKRLGAKHSPVPFAETLEMESFPSVAMIVAGVRELIAGT